MRNTNKMVLTAASVVAGLVLAGSAKADFSGDFDFPLTFNQQYFSPTELDGWTLYNVLGRPLNGAVTGSGYIAVGSASSAQFTGSGASSTGGTELAGRYRITIPLPATWGVGNQISFKALGGVTSGSATDEVGYYYKYMSGPNIGQETFVTLASGASPNINSLATFSAPANLTVGDLFGWYVRSDAGPDLPPQFSVQSFTTVGVPEPATYVMNGLVLLGIGVGGFVSYRKAKKAKV